MIIQEPRVRCHFTAVRSQDSRPSRILLLEVWGDWLRRRIGVCPAAVTRSTAPKGLRLLNASHRFFFVPNIRFQFSLDALDTGFWPSPLLWPADVSASFGPPLGS